MSTHEAPPSRAMRAWLDEACRSGTDTTAALAVFDRLDPVPVGAVLGRWRGMDVPTGHPLDGMLGAFGWAGKDMRDTQTAFPLLFEHHGTVIAIEPKYLPVRLAARWRVHRSRWVRAAFEAMKPVLRTTKPSARLCMTAYRGRSSATLLYDALPIRDVFRRVDDDCLLGLMECRYFEAPFFFVLERA
jgi:hypothetical protein